MSRGLMIWRRGMLSLAVAACSLAGGANAVDQNTPAVPCGALVFLSIPVEAISLPSGGVRVTSAESIEASGGDPGHCRIQGSILPVDPAAPPINFAVAVPYPWNGGSWHMGGSGVNGSIPRLSTTGSGYTPPGTPSLLAQGFAVYGSDSGHQGQGTEWVRNDEAWRNFAYEQLKKTHDAAQVLIQSLYGRKAQARYFSGTSQGGREALEVVARYPEDYVGAIAHVPLAYFQGLMIDPTMKVQTQAQPGAWIPPAKYPLITAAVQGVCDPMDGNEDGVIDNYVGCARALDPSITAAPLSDLRCPSGGDEGEHCLSGAQLATLNSLHGPVRYPYVLPNGFNDWPGWGPGADTALLSRQQPDAAQGTGSFGIGAGVQRQLYGGSADFNLHDLAFGTHRPQIEAASRLLDVPDDWSGFFARGGRLIMITAATDTIANPRAQMRLHDAVVRRSGQGAVDSSVRYYVLPGGPHGGPPRSASGEVQPSAWDAVAALRAWVEQGETPPDAPVMSAYSGQAATMTRPLCRYPLYPHYAGGDRTQAAAYECRAP